MMNANQIKAALREKADADKAVILSRFFKTGKGEYGEGDRFLGLTVPVQRSIMKRYFADGNAPTVSATCNTVRSLLKSTFHEERLTGLLILVEQYKRGNSADKKQCFEFYLESLDRVNNWDLVDLTAPTLVGSYLLDKDSSLLFTMADSNDLWTRRVAVLATFAFIRAGRYAETLSLAERILLERTESHDLMHKAIGWMLREVGKRDLSVLEAFLDKHAARLPRTTLRYAIEKIPEPKRMHYLRAGK